jgi:hypothetical protein
MMMREINKKIRSTNSSTLARARLISSKRLRRQGCQMICFKIWVIIFSKQKSNYPPGVKVPRATRGSKLTHWNEVGPQGEIFPLGVKVSSRGKDP